MLYLINLCFYIYFYNLKRSVFSMFFISKIGDIWSVFELIYFNFLGWLECLKENFRE